MGRSGSRSGRWTGPGMRTIVGLACVLALVASAALSDTARGRSDPIRIGVMLPLSGPDAVSSQLPLSWAQENVNAGGGINGRRIEFVYRDLAYEPALAVARSFASDKSVTAVIGPDNSEDGRQVTSTLIDHRKVVVSPSATSADLFRAYSSKNPRYFWRPVESDIGQVRTMLNLAAQGGAKSVALMTGDSEYGNTFFNWFGFLATEMGLRVTATVRYDQSAQPCQRFASQALASGADALLAVPDRTEQAACIARQYRAAGSPRRLIFSDAAQDPPLIQALGAQAEGLEGMGLAPDPSNGFAKAFKARFGQPPTPYAANTYDSVLLLAYGLARSGGHGGVRLANAISTVAAGTAPGLGWDRPAVAQALSAIGAGRQPAINGAVGRWNFDKTAGVELVASTYVHWRIQGDRFAVAGYLSTANTATAADGLSAQDTPASWNKAGAAGGGSYRPRPKTGGWALLVAASDGWENYRHQADVLAQYQRLRAHGMPADHVVVVSANDLAHSPQNHQPGTVRYEQGGANLYDGLPVDYPLQDMTAARLMAILSGTASRTNPKVIRSGPTDNVFVYLAGHGNQQGLYLGLGAPVASPGANYSILTPQALNRSVADMAAHRRYRRMLIAVEACEGGVLGQELDAPGALLISAASPIENSLSANYDSVNATWLADQFSYELWQAEAATPQASIEALYRQLYLNVDGSHVSAYGPGFGNAAGVRLAEFLTP